VPVTEQVFVAIIVASMGRLERKLFTIADQLAELDAEERQVRAELDHRRDMADDITRDAVLSQGDFDRMEAGLAHTDVTRFERRLSEIERKRAKLAETRTRLLAKLDS
jgi:hypothetical protein